MPGGGGGGPGCLSIWLGTRNQNSMPMTTVVTIWAKNSVRKNFQNRRPKRYPRIIW